VVACCGFTVERALRDVGVLANAPGVEGPGELEIPRGRWYSSNVRFVVRLCVIALLGAAAQCGGPLDPLVCHAGGDDRPRECPLCGEVCRYTRSVDPANLGPCEIGELPEYVGSTGHADEDDGASSSGVWDTEG
jgi:hypothetical protein